MAPSSFAKNPRVLRVRVVFLAVCLLEVSMDAAPSDIDGDLPPVIEEIVGRIEQKHYQAARQLARATLETTPEDLRLRYLVGEAYRAEGDPEAAIAVYEEILVLGASALLTNVCDSLARSRLEMGDTVGLRALFAGDDSGWCRSIDSDLRRELVGLAAFVDGRFVESRELLAPIRNRGALVWHHLGRINFEEGHYAEALRCFDAARQNNDPHSRFENQIYRAWCLLHLNRLEKARDTLKSVSRGFETAEPLYLLGQVELRTDKAQQALSSFKRALALEPTMAEAQYGLASALRRIGEIDKSERALTRFRELHEQEQRSTRRTYELGQHFLADPTAARALDLCRHHLDSGNVERALNHAWTAVRTHGGPEARLFLARALVRSKRFQAAAVHYRRLIAEPRTPKRERLAAESEFRELIKKHAERRESPDTSK